MWSGWGIHQSRGFVAAGTEVAELLPAIWAVSASMLSCSVAWVGLEHCAGRLTVASSGSTAQAHAASDHYCLSQITSQTCLCSYTNLRASWPGSHTKLWWGVSSTGVFGPFGLRNAARWQLPVQGSFCLDCWQASTHRLLGTESELLQPFYLSQQFCH